MIRSVEKQFVKVNCDTLLVDFKFYFARIIFRFHFWVFTSLVFTQVLFTIPKFFTFGSNPIDFLFSPEQSADQLQLTVSYLDGLSVFSVKMQSYLQICSKITKIFLKTLITESSPAEFCRSDGRWESFFFDQLNKKDREKSDFWKNCNDYKIVN